MVVSDVDPTFGEDESRAGDVPVGSNLWLWLLGLTAALLPLLAVVALRQTLELSMALIGGLATVSVALLVAVNLGTLLRLSRFANERHADSTQDKTGTDERASATAPVEISVLDDASYDRLTGLPTFHAFSQRLLDEFQLAKAAGESVAVVLIDINQLAKVNEQFGPEVGDEVLRHVTACLQLSKRSSDLLARMGDDEFGLVLPRCVYEGAQLFVERVKERLAQDSVTVTVQGRATSIWVGICAGAAVAGSATADADEVLTAAVDDLKASRIKRDDTQERWRAAA